MKNIWTYEEHILAFNLYCKIPFSKINANYPPVKELAKIINRSNSSVAMKLANFARLDPALKARNISGLTQGAKGEKIIWENSTMIGNNYLMKVNVYLLNIKINLSNMNYMIFHCTLKGEKGRLSSDKE